jgi:2-phospho-L-lactate transferase/gluconeogenesis factor (CofD/UPF0052 family)
VNRVEALRVVAFGGGASFSVLSTGLRERVRDLTAVVTVADDGDRASGVARSWASCPPAT